MNKNYMPGRKLIIDIVGPLPLSIRQNKLILTIIDVTSRFLQAVSLRNTNTKTIINTLNKYFSKFGLCRELGMQRKKWVLKIE